LEAIEYDRHDTYSVKKLFVRGQQLSGEITQYLHALNSEQRFFGIKMDVVMERKLSIKNETKISPIIL